MGQLQNNIDGQTDLWLVSWCAIVEIKVYYKNNLCLNQLGPTTWIIWACLTRNILFHVIAALESQHPLINTDVPSGVEHCSESLFQVTDNQADIYLFGWNIALNFYFKWLTIRRTLKSRLYPSSPRHSLSKLMVRTSWNSCGWHESGCHSCPCLARRKHDRAWQTSNHGQSAAIWSPSLGGQQRSTKFCPQTWLASRRTWRFLEKWPKNKLFKLFSS